MCCNQSTLRNGRDTVSGGPTGTVVARGGGKGIEGTQPANGAHEDATIRHVTATRRTVTRPMKRRTDAPRALRHLQPVTPDFSTNHCSLTAALLQISFANLAEE